ncbi:MAG: FtsQ-type POTRA domain-containing protein [Desulfovibrionaceae bacterium]
MSAPVKPSYLSRGKTPLKRRPNRRNNMGGRGLSPASSSVRRGLAYLTGLALLGGLMAALYFGYLWATTTPLFALEEIKVEGNDRLSYGDVLVAGKIRLGQNCLGVNVGRAEALLAKNPWVESVAVRRELPDRLLVSMVEKKPAFWIRRGGSLYYADNRGELIAAVSPADFKSLPVLEADTGVRELTTELPEMLRALAATGLDLTPEGLAWVRVSDAGQMRMFLDGAGLTLTFGLKDWRSEVRRLAAAVQDMRRRGEIDSVTRISALGGKVWVEKRT